VVAVPETLPEDNLVLIAYDGSLQAARALQLVTLLGVLQGKSVLVCSVHKDAESAKRWAETAGEFLNDHGVQASLHPIATTSSPAEVLLQEADQHHAGLIVAGAYGQPILKEFFFGSVTQTLLREGRAPLFLFH
jgi:nucleotide-binding universal stress UspA family protein